MDVMVLANVVQVYRLTDIADMAYLEINEVFLCLRCGDCQKATIAD
jgi:hypothetical protein